MSTRFHGRLGTGPAIDPAEPVALVAAAKRDVLLRVHAHRLRREDLEDCYGQATLELIVLARGGRAFVSRRHLANALEQRFLARVLDRRRAVMGRSPIAAALEGAVPFSGDGDKQLELPDTREEPERIVVAREDLTRALAHMRSLSADQRRVLATQLVLAKDLPYGPAGHPDPLGASEEDCSSTVNYVLIRAGIRPLAEVVRENPLAQDYPRWGAPGPGRWVTIYATDAPTPHVFVTIAGLRLDTSHAGTDVGPNRAEDGPRWRLFDRIPDWAPWSVRHPPGL